MTDEKKEPLPQFPIFDRSQSVLDRVDQDADPLTAPTILDSQLDRFAVGNLQYTDAEIRAAEEILANTFATRHYKSLGALLFSIFIHGMLDGVRLQMAQTRADMALSSQKDRVQ